MRCADGPEQENSFGKEIPRKNSENEDGGDSLVVICKVVLAKHMDSIVISISIMILVSPGEWVESEGEDREDPKGHPVAHTDRLKNQDHANKYHSNDDDLAINHRQDYHNHNTDHQPPGLLPPLCQPPASPHTSPGFIRA